MWHCVQRGLATDGIVTLPPLCGVPLAGVRLSLGSASSLLLPRLAAPWPAHCPPLRAPQQNATAHYRPRGPESCIALGLALATETAAQNRTQFFF